MDRRSIDRVAVSAYTVPTVSPESDGTFAWNQTTIVIVQAGAGGVRGLGYTYADIATAHLIDHALKHEVIGMDAMAVTACWVKLVQKIRNLGRPGICSMAIAGLDNCLWDLKARLLDISLYRLIGAARESIDVYGSGGFTSYSIEQLQKQLRGWAEEGIRSVKMKIGTHPEDDLNRVKAARAAIGPTVNLFVDANGAYSRKQALEKARQFAELNVSWFEEPVSSDDLEGLRLLRDQGPAGMSIAAGEYGYDARYFRRMMEAGAVDVMQCDATRCAGLTEFLNVAGLCEANCLPLSAHTAPTLHAHACCGTPRSMNVEYFFDHYRIEQMFFDGALHARQGKLHPDPAAPGMGLTLKHPDIDKYKVFESQ